MVFFTKYSSPLGILLLTAEDGCLTGLYLDSQPCPHREMQPWDTLPVFDTVRDWLDRYFRGKAPSPEPLPLSPSGTAFQMQVCAAFHTEKRSPTGILQSRWLSNREGKPCPPRRWDRP